MQTPPEQAGNVKYVYLDIVGFTKDRSVEAQSDVVAAINGVVRSALGTLAAGEVKRVLIPTGDGMAIAFVESGQYDLHLQVAVEILRLLASRNSIEPDPKRRFEVRIGVNENLDNLILDINEKLNVAGQGISQAQRIMDHADGGQILIGQPVYDRLHARERYTACFRTFQAKGKHGSSFPVYQYIKEAAGLNIAEPSAFARVTAGIRFPKTVAFLVAHAFTNREFLLGRRSDTYRDEAATILLWFLALDSVDKEESPAHEEPAIRTQPSGTALFSTQYEYYLNLHSWVLHVFAGLIGEAHLYRFGEHFESTYHPTFWLPKSSALKKVAAEWPSIAQDFQLSEA